MILPLLLWMLFYSKFLAIYSSFTKSFNLCIMQGYVMDSLFFTFSRVILGDFFSIQHFYHHLYADNAQNGFSPSTLLFEFQVCIDITVSPSKYPRLCPSWMFDLLSHNLILYLLWIVQWLTSMELRTHPWSCLPIHLLLQFVTESSQFNVPKNTQIHPLLSLLPAVWSKLPLS